MALTVAVPAIAPAASTTTAAALSTIPPLVLPQPLSPDDAEARPSDPSGPKVVFHLAIPKIGLDTDVYEGVDLDTLSNGPGHWPGSATPGQRGNVVIAGHRVTWAHPFYDLDLLEPGDEIIAGESHYRVDRVFVV